MSCHSLFQSVMRLHGITTWIGSVQRVCSAVEEAAWLQDGGIQTGSEDAAGRDGQDEGVLGRNSQCKIKCREIKDSLNISFCFPESG